MHLLKRPTLPDAVPRLRVGRIASRKCGALGIHLQPQVSPSKCEQSEPEGAEEYHRMYIRQALPREVVSVSLNKGQILP